MISFLKYLYCLRGVVGGFDRLSSSLSERVQSAALNEAALAFPARMLYTTFAKTDAVS